MLANGIKEETTTTGTGTVTLTSTTGMVRVSDVFGVGDLVSYSIKSGNNWEWGIGTVGASNTLARTRPQATYASGTYSNDAPSAITLAGTSEVYCTPHSGPWQGIGSAQRGGADVYIFGHGTAAVATQDRAQGANQITYCLLPILRPFKVTALSINARTASGANIRLGLYSTNTTGDPSALLVDAGEVTASSTGNLELTLGTPIILLPGTYWTAAILSETTTIRGLNSTGMPSIGLTSLAASGLFCTAFENQTYGAFPSTATPTVNSSFVIPALVYVKGRNL